MSEKRLYCCFRNKNEIYSDTNFNFHLFKQICRPIENSFYIFYVGTYGHKPLANCE